ncbi:MAG TPA: hypothetical protein VFU19_08080 [Iamia sp.]|nr:hypothetical protein [Iamia sp.]
MRARPPITRVEAGHLVVRTALEAADGTELPPLEVRVPIAQADRLDPTATPGVPALLVAAAVRGEDLHVEGPVDARMAAGAPGIMAVLADWWGLGPRTVTVDETYATPPGGDDVGLFFSRGVDSWSTLLDLLDEPPGDRVTHLLAVFHADDVRRVVQTEVIAGHRPVLDELGLELVTVETSVRQLLDPYRRWIDTAALALTGTGLQVAAGFRRLVLTGDHPADVHARTGIDSHLIGPLRTGRTEVVLGNPGRTRGQRIAHLLGSPLARRSLQVCWAGLTTGNCGRCGKCLITMAELAIAGDPDPAAGFDAPIDPDHVRAMTLGPEMGPFMTPILEGLPPEHEELRRAWSDAWDRANAVDPGARWGDDAPPGLSGPGLPTRVAAAIRATTGQPVAPAPAPLGWRDGTVPLRPAHDRHDEIRALADAAPDRARAWAVVEHHIRGEARDGRQADLAVALAGVHGPGVVYLPGILWDHLAPPVLDPGAVQRLLRAARARLWWREGGDLEPLRVVEAIEQGCLPLQVMPSAAARELARDLPPALTGLVVDAATLPDLDLAPAAVATRLGPVVDHLLAGSAEHDLLVGAYQ